MPKSKATHGKGTLDGSCQNRRYWRNEPSVLICQGVAEADEPRLEMSEHVGWLFVWLARIAILHHHVQTNRVFSRVEISVD